MSLTTRLAVTLNAVQVSNKDLTSVRAPIDYAKALTLASGTAAGQADLIFSDTRTLAASASETLDLAGSLVDAIGATLTFARVKGLIVYAAPGNVNDVVIGGAVSNAFVGPFADATDKIKVRPGGILALFAPAATAYPVTAGTGDLLQVANSGAGTAITYDVILIGASA
ncbi:hypothetical protein [Streptomyces sp. NPDC020983]|uniref:hypothetical protein n=1 Tax=Streptomyces sp. NPDC020983 TaxID=3365106 RepID=UPI003799083F